MSAARVIVGISGASGAVYGARLLQMLREIGGIESHLVVSDAGWRNLRHEMDLSRPEVESLADEVHDIANVGASIASGSFATLGMVVAPCSMRTLAAIAHGLADNLLTRAADVMLKERRRLVLMVRETPFSAIHVDNMARLARVPGVMLMPPMLTFYNGPATLDDAVHHIAAKALEAVGVSCANYKRWS